MRKLISAFLMCTTSSGWGYVAKDVVNCSVKLARSVNNESFLRSRILRQNAKSLFYPKLSASVTPTTIQAEDLNTRGNFTSISIRQKLIDLESYTLNDSTEYGLQASRDDLMSKAFDNSMLALDDLAQISLQENQLKLIQAQLESYQMSARIIEAGSSIGISDSNDYLQLQAQTSFLKAEVNRLTFEINRRKNVFTYKYSYNAVELTEIQKTNEEIVVRVENFPAVRSLVALLEQSRFEKLVYQRRLWPQLSLDGSYAMVGSDRPNLPGYPKTTASIALVADFSNFWGEKVQRELQDPIITTRLNKRNYIINNLKTEFRQLDQELELLKNQAPLVKSRVDFAMRSKEVSRAKLRLGRVSFLEIQQAEQAAFLALYDQYQIQLRTHQVQLKKEIAKIFESTSEQESASCPL